MQWGELLFIHSTVRSRFCPGNACYQGLSCCLAVSIGCCIVCEGTTL